MPVAESSRRPIRIAAIAFGIAIAVAVIPGVMIWRAYSRDVEPLDHFEGACRVALGKVKHDACTAREARPSVTAHDLAAICFVDADSWPARVYEIAGANMDPAAIKQPWPFKWIVSKLSRENVTTALGALFGGVLILLGARKPESTVDKVIHLSGAWLRRNLDRAGVVAVAAAVIVGGTVLAAAGFASNVLRERCIAAQGNLAAVTLAAESRCYRAWPSPPPFPPLSPLDANVIASAVYDRLSPRLQGIENRLNFASPPAPDAIATAVHAKLHPAFGELENKLAASAENWTASIITACAIPDPAAGGTVSGKQTPTTTRGGP